MADVTVFVGVSCLVCKRKGLLAQSKVDDAGVLLGEHWHAPFRLASAL